MKINKFWIPQLYKYPSLLAKKHTGIIFLFCMFQCQEHWTIQGKCCWHSCLRQSLQLLKIVPHFSFLHIWNIIYLFSFSPGVFNCSFLFLYYSLYNTLIFLVPFNYIIFYSSQSVVCKSLWFPKTLSRG